MAQNIPPIPKVVPIPKGWRRAYPKEISPVIQRAAVRALQQALPIGKMQAVDVNGKLFGFQTEWHYDDHVTKPGKPIWHPGISTLVPTTQPKQLVTQSVRDAQFIQSSRMTGEDMNNTSNIGGEGVLRRFFRALFSPPSKKVPAPTKNQGELAQSLMVLNSKVRGEEDALFGEGIDEYDSITGADFGDEMGDEDNFGFDEFGAVKKRAFKAKFKAKGKVNVKTKSKPKSKSRFVAKPAPRTPVKARPAPRPTSRPAARPMPAPAARPVSRPTPFSPVAVKPEEPIEEPVEMVQEEPALDTYSMPVEETPETADEGSETFDPSAIGIDTSSNIYG